VSYYLAGDYVYAGDPGLFGFLGGVIKKVAGVGLKAAGAVLGGTPVGMAATAISRAVMPTQNIPTIQPMPMPVLRAAPQVMPQMPGGPVGAAEAAPTGRARNVIIGGKRYHYNKYGELKKGRIPVMNSLNPRALARSSRRIDGMRKGMGKALKHTNYKLVSKSAGRGRGSKGVITRSEAARALRG
jgi:hypothetical protein